MKLLRGFELRISFYIATLLLVSSMYAQSASSGEARLSRAYHLGTLEVKGTLPFHLEADFEEKLWEGGTRKGTITEDWLGPQWKRRVLKTSDGTYTALTANGIQYYENSSLLSGAERELLLRFFIPVPDAKAMFEGRDVATQQVNGKGLNLQCYRFDNFRKQYYHLPPVAETYCVDDQSGDLRLVQDAGGQHVSYADLQPFGIENRIARTLVLSRPSGVIATLHVSTIISAPQLSESDFSVSLSMNKGRSQKEAIEYENTLDKVRGSLLPLNLKDRVVSTALATRSFKGVIVSVKVSPEGHVIDLTILSPVDEAVASSTAKIVQQLRFQPFTVQGKSVAVETTLLILDPPAKP